MLRLGSPFRSSASPIMWKARPLLRSRYDSLDDFAYGMSPSLSDSLEIAGSCGIAVGDVDGDGHRDIAVACAKSKNVALFCGRGEGKYERVFLPWIGGWGSIAAADLNGDGKDDLVTANYEAGNITIFLRK